MVGADHAAALVHPDQVPLQLAAFQIGKGPLTGDGRGDDDPQVGALVQYIGEHVPRALFRKAELGIGAGVFGADHGEDRPRVPQELGGAAQPVVPRRGGALQQTVIDLQDLLRGLQELHAKGRGRDAAVGALEHRLAQLLFGGLDGGAEPALGDIELFRRLVDGAAGKHLHDLAKLADLHDRDLLTPWLGENGRKSAKRTVTLDGQGQIRFFGAETAPSFVFLMAGQTARLLRQPPRT